MLPPIATGLLGARSFRAVGYFVGDSVGIRVGEVGIDVFVPSKRLLYDQIHQLREIRPPCQQ